MKGQLRGIWDADNRIHAIWGFFFVVPGRRSHEQSLRLLGRAVRELREQRGLSVEALAAAASLHATYVTGLEQGRKNPSYHQLLRLAEGLGVQPIALLLRIEELDTHDPDDPSV